MPKRLQENLPPAGRLPFAAWALRPDLARIDTGIPSEVSFFYDCAATFDGMPKSTQARPRTVGCEHAAVQEPQHLWKDVLGEGSGVWLWSLDPDTHALTFIGAGAPLAGQSPPNLDGWISAFHLDDAGRAREAFSRALAAGTSDTLDVRLHVPVGGWRHIRIGIRAVRYPDGRHRLHGLCQDMTELAQLREALNEEKRLAALTERLSGVGYWRTRSGTGKFYWSDQMYRIYGLDPATCSPTIDTIFSYCHPDDREKLQRHHAEFAARDAPEISLRIVRPDGEVRHVLARSVTERDETGTIVARFGTLCDITDIKRAEAQARESEQRYRFIAEYAPDMIARTTLQGEVLYVSPSSVRVFGYTPEEHMKLNARDFVHPEDFPWVMAQIFKLIENRWQRLPEPLCYRARHKNGHWIWIEANPTQIFNDAGEPVEFVDIVRDVTQTKKFEEELKDARKRAEAAAAAKSAFLANMSHELRTPLTSIIGFARLMDERQELPTEAKYYAKCIRDASEALLAVINEVLDFSKLEAGQVKLDQKPVAFNALVREAIGLIAIQAEAKGLSITTDLDPTTPDRVMGDAARLRQVLLNLLSNAVKFTDRGGITVRTAFSTGDRCRLKVSVIDTGCGIAPEAVSRLFERFSQAEVSTNRAHGGTGLGLAISKSVIGLMGGDIGVETEVGKGSCFWFEIPTEAAPQESEPKRSLDTVPDGRKLTLLIVDDTEINRELLRLMLEPLGHVTEEAPGGAEAVQAALLRPFDIILMDVRMPRMDGLEATRLIRETSALNRMTPIIALTADVEPENAAACRAAGMNDVIAKPILLEKLVAKLNEWGGAAAKSNASPPDDGARLRA